MSASSLPDKFNIPGDVNYVTAGHGDPVILIHGLAASLHDWDALVPQLVEKGYAAYAPDLLGHGDSPKPAVPGYRMEWLVDHFSAWLNGLGLTQRPVLIGHSLGGYVALEYARQFPEKVRGLVLVDPFYSNEQLPVISRLAYSHPTFTGVLLSRGPRWLVRWIIDITSLFMGHRTGGMHALPAEVRAQTTVDYLRTAPAAYGILNADLDLTPYLAAIGVPSLVIWGEQDRTLAPASFADLASKLPQGATRSIRTGHVPHQAYAEWFNLQVLDFLAGLAAG